MNSDSADTHDKTAKREEKIRAEQARLFFRQLPLSTIVGYIAAIIYTISFRQETDNLVLLSLLVFLSITTAVSLWLYRCFKQHELDNKKTVQLCQYNVVVLFFSALVWSILLCWVYDPNVPQNAYFIMFSCIGFLVGAAPLLSNFSPSYLVYAPTFSTPLILTWVTGDNTQYQMIGVLVFAVLILMLFFSYWLNRTWRNSINLQFDNLDLVESLQIQKNAADQANMAKSKFLAAASHDLRQPLHALSLFTAVLDEAVEQPKIRHVVGQITMSVKALESLFNALLDISKLDAGVLKPEKKPFELQAMFTKLANDYGAQAREKGIDLVWPRCSHTLFTDANLLEQILRNYISNAIRYTNSGRVEISCDSDDSTSIKINVTDTGMGISKQEQQAIFDEFYQLGNPERERSKGLGLGLAIVQRTANLLGHPISVQSTFGKGSTFSIRVSRSTAKATADIPPLDSHININPVGTIKPVILVIDDEMSVRQGTQALLELWGCEVLTASDKAEALTKLKQENQIPDGIIADYRLREQQTGVDAIYAIHKECNQEMPALIITGDIDSNRLLEINKSGFQVLHKPVATLKLRTFIDHIRIQQNAFQA
ncbi:ATP-binding response regulator [Marinomonas transparens]|uniref:histidine kinase n=1 Tax=Marinomonas transparens TaxID=2795388 RepID=A0A934N4X2_9GAMM|nr:hybrid sensor histidine kinase/response regulator [Marinomonas transparens]MBJ7536456.1 response regulator [Marinomonas transparens]